MPPVKHAVVAAAGLGSRLGKGKPKCLVEVGGRPIIAYLMDLLRDVEDVRVVVGFCEEQVMHAVKDLRSDVIFVRNPNYHATKTLESYAMGAAGITAPVLFMDADIIFEASSFRDFLAQGASDGHVVGITDAKTEDAVFVQLDAAKRVTAFSREEKSAFEWANLLLCPGDYFEGKSGDVYRQLEKDLPLVTRYVNSFEVDRLSDLERAEAFVRSAAFRRG